MDPIECDIGCQEVTIKSETEKNTNSKILKRLLICLFTGLHSHMLKFSNDEKTEFEVWMKDKKNKKEWKKESISLFEDLDAVSDKPREKEKFEEKTKNRFKSNMIKFINMNCLKFLGETKLSKTSVVRKYRILKFPAGMKYSELLYQRSIALKLSASPNNMCIPRSLETQQQNVCNTATVAHYSCLSGKPLKVIINRNMTIIGSENSNTFSEVKHSIAGVNQKAAEFNQNIFQKINIINVCLGDSCIITEVNKNGSEVNQNVPETNQNAVLDQNQINVGSEKSFFLSGVNQSMAEVNQSVTQMNPNVLLDRNIVNVGLENSYTVSEVNQDMAEMNQNVLLDRNIVNVGLENSYTVSEVNQDVAEMNQNILLNMNMINDGLGNSCVIKEVNDNTAGVNQNVFPVENLLNLRADNRCALAEVNPNVAYINQNVLFEGSMSYEGLENSYVDTQENQIVAELNRNKRKGDQLYTLSKRLKPTDGPLIDYCVQNEFLGNTIIDDTIIDDKSSQQGADISLSLEDYVADTCIKDIDLSFLDYATIFGETEKYDEILKVPHNPLLSSAMEPVADAGLTPNYSWHTDFQDIDCTSYMFNDLQ